MSTRGPEIGKRAPRTRPAEIARIPTERRASGSSRSHPILRQTDEAQLQPLAEAAASKDRLEGAVAARATLAERVSAELALSINRLQVGLALEMARHHIPLAEYEAHWGTACMIKMLARAEFLFRTSGRTMHMSPPTRELPEGLVPSATGCCCNYRCNVTTV